MHVDPTLIPAIMSVTAASRSRMNGILSSIHGSAPLHCVRMTLRQRRSSMPRLRLVFPAPRRRLYGWLRA